jgi:hypothetical protein
MSGQKPHTIGPFFDGGPMWFGELIRMLAQLRPGGQLGESGEYQMGRSMCGLFSCSEPRRC